MTDDQRMAIALLDGRGYIDTRLHKDGHVIPVISVRTKSKEHLRLLHTLVPPTHMRRLGGLVSIVWRNDDALALGQMIQPYMRRRSDYLDCMLALSATCDARPWGGA